MGREGEGEEDEDEDEDKDKEEKTISQLSLSRQKRINLIINNDYLYPSLGSGQKKKKKKKASTTYPKYPHLEKKYYPGGGCGMRREGLKLFR